MAQQLIDVGSAANDGTGDPFREAWQKDNANFTELYKSVAIAVASVAALRALSVSGMLDGTACYVRGYYAAQDGGEGFFIYDAASSATQNGGTIIQPDAGSGRWRRAIHDRGTFNVRWYGAKGDNTTDDTTAVNAAVIEAEAASITSNARVYFPPGRYRHQGLRISYVSVELVGHGSGTSRLCHIDGNFCPLIYVTGGGFSVAVPYGGVKGLTLHSGDSTFPAIQYYDQQIDNQLNMDDVSYDGTATGATAKFCDGLSLFDYLNCNKKQFRTDGVGGYGIRLRGDSCIAIRGASTATGTGSYKVTAAVDLTGTGFITLQSPSARLLDGTGVWLFTAGSLPTVTSGDALVIGKDQVYYTGRGTTEYGIVLYRTRADAIAGTNKITYSGAQTGNFSFAVFPATFEVTAVDTATDTLTYNNDKNIIISTSIIDGGGKTTVYGSGYTNTFTVGTTPNVGALHMVFVYSTGSMPGGLTQGTPYYPIYVDAKTIKLASTLANAQAGTGIDITSAGSGVITILYDHQISRLGAGMMDIQGWTYDNQGSVTAETINSVACGGLGCMYVDNSQFLFKGPIRISGNRYEINKMPARDLVFGSGKLALFRFEVGWGGRTGSASAGPPTVQLHLESMTVELAVGLIGAMVRLVGNRDNGDVCPSFDQIKLNNIGQGYDNDNGTAKSKTPVSISGSHTSLDNVHGDYTSNLTPGLVQGGYFSSHHGIQNSPLLITNATSAVVKSGDLLHSLDAEAAFYKAMQPTAGYSRGAGAVSAGTVTGTVGSAVFTLSANVPVGCGIGTSVKIPGAGASGADLVGIIKHLDQLSATKSIVLGNATVGTSYGQDLLCETAVTGVTMTFMPVFFAGVYPEYVVSGALNFGSVSAQSHADLTIAAPANVTFTVGKACRLGMTAPVNGLQFFPFVTSDGASVTIRAVNYTGSPIDPGSVTFRVFVEA